MFDSGATKSLISSVLVHKCNLPIFPCAQFSLSAVADIAVNLVGVTSVEISLKGEKFFIDCLVVEHKLSSSFDVLLGSDFLEKFGFTLNFKYKQLSNDDMLVSWASYDEHCNVLRPMRSQKENDIANDNIDRHNNEIQINHETHQVKMKPNSDEWVNKQQGVQSRAEENQGRVKKFKDSQRSRENEKVIQSEKNSEREILEQDYEFLKEDNSWVVGKLNKKVKLSPNSEKIFYVSFDQKDFVQNQVVISPIKDDFKNDILIAHSVSSVDNGKCLIQVMNMSDKEITLNKHSKLVKIQSCDLIAQSKDMVNTVQQYDLEPDFQAWGGEINLNHLQSHEKEKIVKLLRRFKNIFASDIKDLGCCDTITHKIRLTDNNPVRQKPFRVPHHLQPEMKRQIDQLLEAGIIEPSTTPYAAPVLLVKKQDGSYRLVSDLRKLNEKTLPDNFPLPNMNEMLDMLGGANYFSTLDLTSGFYQMKLDDEDIHKTGIVVQNMGSFQYLRLPFGLKNASASFQRLMSLILAGLSPLSIGVYIDDIIIASKTFEEHLARLEIVFDRLKQHNLRLKPKKCFLAQSEISFLGHKIKDGKILPDPKNIEAVLNFKVPATKKQVRAFLGLTGFYRKFIQNFAEIAFPLTKLTKNNVKFTWSEEADKAYTTLKQSLISYPCLRLARFDRPFAIATDASSYALGCVLLQEDEEGFQHPIACASRKLSDSELNYSVFEKEALGIVFGVNHFKHYLLGKKFTIYCDQKSLSYVFTLKDSSARIARWILALQEYDYDIIHKPGKFNLFADHLSREVGELKHNNSKDEEAHVNSNCLHVELSAIPNEDIRVRQNNDEYCGSILRKLNTSRENIMHPKFKFFVNEDKVLMCQEKHIGRVNYFSRQPKLVIPSSLKSEVLFLCHDNSCATHPGLSRTMSRIRKAFYWPGYFQDVKNYVASCNSCLARRGYRPKQKAPLQHIPIAERPFQKVAIDAVGPLVMSRNGNKWILVLSDYFTRWPEAYPVPDITSKTVAKVLVDYISRHGIMEILYSDRGSNFISDAILEVCKVLGIKKQQTVSYNPQGNGVVEKLNATLVNSLSYLVNKNQLDWCEHIPLALFAHRTNCHSALRDSPAFVTYGRDLRTPIDLLSAPPVRSYADTLSYAKLLAIRLQSTYKDIQDRLEAVAKKQEKLSREKGTVKKIEVGDSVFLHSDVIPVGISKKLHRSNDGPFRVIEKKSPVLFEIALVKDPSKVQTVHINRIIPMTVRKEFENGEALVSSDLAVPQSTINGETRDSEHRDRGQTTKFLVTSPGTLLHPIWSFEKEVIPGQNCAPIGDSSPQQLDISNDVINDERVFEELDIGANEEVPLTENQSSDSICSRLRQRDRNGFVIYRR